MKQVFRFLLIVLSLAVFTTSLSFANSIPRDEQKRIIETYLYTTGRLKDRPASMAQSEDREYPYEKCGMSAVADFALNRNKFDADLQKRYNLASLSSRPAGLPLTYVSPSGRFKIHYTKTGADSVYKASTDIGPANGVPDYVDTVATVLDSAYNFTITDLGYPEPPSDGFYAAGGDSAFDVYIHNLGSSFYGLSYIDSISVDGPSTLRATSFMELDNDYQQITPYKNRPLDAVRVTVAHEYFHSVQFGIDFTEAEDHTDTVLVKRYWMEMSAVWMEEQQYDQVNDYYYYLPSFFDHPGRSLQQFKSFSDLHPYGSAVFPIYLSERFGREAIRQIWLKCGEYGAGASFLQAAETILDSINNVAPQNPSFAFTFREFALWNYFTGSRAGEAPPGLGYSERANYPDILADSMLYFADSTIITANGNRRNPDHNGSIYIVWSPDSCTPYIYDTIYSYWKCNAGGNPCTDSTMLNVSPDSIPPDTAYDFKHIVDSQTLVLYLSLDPRPNSPPALRYDQWWGLSVIYSLAGAADSQVINTGLIPSDKLLPLAFPNAPQYKSITLILSPASEILGYYRVPSNPLWVGLLTLVKQLADTCPPPEPPDTTTPANMVPYPNPAIVKSMSDGTIGFAFKYGALGSHLLQVDVFSEAGEYLTTVTATGTSANDIFTANWDMKNDLGKIVGSGVYLLRGRLYADETPGTVIAEDQSKVLIVR